MDAALQVLDAEEPDLFFVTLVCVNIVGHMYGTDSPEIRAAVEETDRQIGRLLDHLQTRGWLDDTLIVVASDHGMTNRPSGIDVLAHLEDAGRGVQCCALFAGRLRWALPARHHPGSAPLGNCRGQGDAKRTGRLVPR
jgi:hypothetical protein